MYKQGQIMSWNPGVVGFNEIPVKICGVATTGCAILGITYIVEPMVPLPGSEYTHVAAFECHLRYHGD